MAIAVNSFAETKLDSLKYEVCNDDADFFSDHEFVDADSAAVTENQLEPSNPPVGQDYEDKMIKCSIIGCKNMCLDI